jgi:hypothetical protein
MIPNPHSIESLANIPILRTTFDGSETELFELGTPLIVDPNDLAVELETYLTPRPEVVRAWQEFAEETKSTARLFLRGNWVGDVGGRYPRGVGYSDPVLACIDYIFWRVLTSTPWGSRRFEPTVQFLAEVLRWYSDEPQPGLIELSIRDASGREHRIISKWVYYLNEFDWTTTYPFEVWVDAEVAKADDTSVTVTLPWGTETVEGETTLSLTRINVVELK